MREFHPLESRDSGGDPPAQERGFTLLELVFVVTIMGLLLWIAVPALQGANGAKRFSMSVDEVGKLLSHARAQAMLRAAHVFVGFYESDGARSDSIHPAPGGTGRLWVGVAATKDGTAGYDTTNSVTWDASNLTPVGKLRFFDNLHLATNVSFYSSVVTTNTVSPVGDASSTNTPFGWPLENSNTITQFTNGVIEFTPQGTAMLPGSSNTPEYIQIALIPTRGNLVVNNTSNAAVIQIDAITGAIKTFRP